MTTSDPAYDSSVYLHVNDANMRFAAAKNVAYTVELYMPKGDLYAGKIRCSLDLAHVPPGDELFLDFRGVKVTALKVNGSEVAKPDFRDHKVYLPSAKLTQGANTVEMLVLNRYRIDGTGLHSFVDQQDGLQYLYTQFEPDYCHFVFPCFDQPDMKATWQFTAVTEDDWCVITNENAVSSDHQAFMDYASVFGEDKLPVIQKPRVTFFRESDRISTYLYAIVAGPFDYFEKNVAGLPEMKIYARKTVMADLALMKDEMFMVTECGMHFYKEFFGKAYPFRKYDQVFVPEHNAGAMENVGCVTYNELYLCRGEARTVAKRLRFSITNLHELAHMWFGNLVTMKWWNDLWLNEAFATFMSFLAMEKSALLTDFHPTCWVTFCQYSFWGVQTDQLSSTHPICANIDSTAQVEQMFDGISYGKGSAFLKQFYNMLGYETMKQGLHAYFDRHQWGNTTLPDFVNAMQEAWVASGDKSLGADFNLVKWADEWLKTSGINIVEPTLDGDSITITQSMGLRGNNRLRRQKINVSLYDESGQIHVINDQYLSEKDERTKVDLSSLPQNFKPAAIYLNEGCHGYLKVRFDKQSINWLIANTYKIQNAQTRCTIWRYFWMLVLDVQMTSLQYIDFVEKNLIHESVEQIITLGLMNLSTLISRYIPTSLIAENKNKIFRTLLHLIQNRKDLPLDPLVDQIFTFVGGNQENLALIKEWARAGWITKEADKIYELQKKHKFTILTHVFRQPDLPLDAKMAMLNETMGDDKTDLAVNARAKCMAALPNAESKAQTWAELTDAQSKDSVYVRTAKIGGFYCAEQLPLIEPYFAKFFAVLPEIAKSCSHRYLETFFYSLLPTYQVEDAYIVKLISLKTNTPDSQHAFRQMLQDGIEIMLRCAEIREFAKL